MFGIWLSQGGLIQGLLVVIEAMALYLYRVDMVGLWGSIVKSQACGCRNFESSRDGWVLGKLVWGGLCCHCDSLVTQWEKTLGTFPCELVYVESTP